jgi:hypothetical protein
MPPFTTQADMSAAEEMFFLGSPLAHVVAYEERRRLQRIERLIMAVG